MSLVVACSSSDTNNGTSGTGGTSSERHRGTSGTSGSSSKYKTCPTATQSTCSQADLDAYNACTEPLCDADLQKCFGANYKQGTFGGDCSDYITCSQACACGDSACTTACVQKITPACQTCTGRSPAAQGSYLLRAGMRDHDDDELVVLQRLDHELQRLDWHAHVRAARDVLREDPGGSYSDLLHIDFRDRPGRVVQRRLPVQRGAGDRRLPLILANSNV